MTTAICIKEHICKSFPNDHIISVGETVNVKGLFMEDSILIELDTVKHPSAYKHLPSCHSCVDTKVFEDKFQILK
jgi:hypothetical protein